MGGIGDIPEPFAAGEVRALSPVVEEGEPHPLQGTEGVQGKVGETHPLGDAQGQQSPAAGGVQEKPQEGLFAYGPVAGKVKGQDE